VTTRDYRRGAQRRPRGNAKTGFSGWAGLAIGLGVGAIVAGGVWHYKSRPAAEPVVAKEKKPAPRSATDDASDKEPAGSGTEYTFYDKLKNFEVVIPEKEKDVHRDVKPAPETTPGTYILQAGSYKNFADADRIRAQLALQGVESKVQKVTVESESWFRVRIGPFSNLEQLNRTRARLRQADVPALLVRVGD
jgi:cell division protein FtsN